MLQAHSRVPAKNQRVATLGAADGEGLAVGGAFVGCCEQLAKFAASNTSTPKRSVASLRFDLERMVLLLESCHW
jgi:hypothetical protein